MTARRAANWLCALLLMLACGASLAATPAMLGNEPLAELFGHLEFVEDPGQAMTLDQVRALPPARFVTLTPENFRQRFSRSAFWPCWAPGSV